MSWNEKAAMEATVGSSGLRTRETIKESLERQRAEVKAHLDNLDDALKFLNENPSFDSFYNTLRKAGF